MANTNSNELQAKNAGRPKFGRLLVVLLLAVGMIVAITFLSEAYYTP